MKKYLLLHRIGIPALFLLTPVLAFAAPSTIKDFFCLVVDLLSLIVGVLGAIAFAVFLWGIATYVFKADQEDARDKGRFIMTWGLIAMFLLFSIWGVLRLLYGELGFEEPFGTILLPGTSTGGACAS